MGRPERARARAPGRPSSRWPARSPRRGGPPRGNRGPAPRPALPPPSRPGRPRRTGAGRRVEGTGGVEERQERQVLDLLPGGRVGERLPAAQTVEHRRAVTRVPRGAPELGGGPEPLVPVILVVVRAAAVLVTGRVL